MEYSNLLFDVKESIAFITINREKKLNALNREVLDELGEVFDSIKNNDSILAVIITGAGEKAFIAGADISELNKLDKESGERFALYGQQIFNKIENLGKPVVAAVNGFALGGGCELALSCHIRLASENAKFGQPEVNLGILPGYGGTQRLTRLINPGRSLEYILTGDMIDAKTALAIGLANKVYPPDSLLDEAEKLCRKIITKAPIAVKYAQDVVKAASNFSLEDGLKYEAKLFGECCGTEDFKEGTAAFLEKRKAEFKNK